MPGGERGLLAVAGWPRAELGRVDEAAEADLGRLIEAVTAVRRYRDEVGAKPSAALRGRLAAEGYGGLEAQLGRLARVELVDDGASNGDVLANVPLPGGALQVLPSEAFDSGEAQARTDRRRADLQTEIERAERKLANDKFVERAPAHVVEEERRKLEEYRDAMDRLGS